jgi:type I restriction enzyme M protein
MAKKAKRVTTESKNGATVGYERQLGELADALRGSMNAAEYRHVVLGLVFLRYISDAFEDQHAKLVADKKKSGADPEDPDEYRAQSIFWVPPALNADYILANQPFNNTDWRSAGLVGGGF